LGFLPDSVQAMNEPQKQYQWAPSCQYNTGKVYQITTVEIDTKVW